MGLYFMSNIAINNLKNGLYMQFTYHFGNGDGGNFAYNGEIIIEFMRSM